MKGRLLLRDDYLEKEKATCSNIKYLPVKRQTLLFSATIPKDIEKVASKYLNNPERIAIDTKQITVEKIKQDIIFTSESSKYDEFLNQIQNREGSIVVFMRTKFSTEKMATRLKKEGYKWFTIIGVLIVVIILGLYFYFK